MSYLTFNGTPFVDEVPVVALPGPSLLRGDSWRWTMELSRLNLWVLAPPSALPAERKAQMHERVHWLRERIRASMQPTATAHLKLIAAATRYEVGGYE